MNMKYEEILDLLVGDYKSAYDRKVVINFLIKLLSITKHLDLAFRIQEGEDVKTYPMYDVQRNDYAETTEFKVA